jgi:iron complex transport system permease protein
LKHISCRWILVLLALLLVVSLFAALIIGDVAISSEEWIALLGSFFKNGTRDPALQLQYQVVFHLRMPRMCLAILAGGALSLAGVVFQACFRNPLVSPDILGVSAGGALGAMTLMLMVPAASVWLISLSAFVGGLLAVVLVLLLARGMPAQQTLSMILLGIVLTSVFNALLVAVKYLADPSQKLPAILFWTLGSLNRAGWSAIFPLLVGTVFLGALVYSVRFRLNLVSIGDRESHAMGFRPDLFRKVMLLSASVLVAAVVAVCGQIGWLALVSPHLARALVGPNHTRMLPVAVLLGALMLLWADLLSHGLSVIELPVSVMTSVVGAPLFVWLIFKQKGLGWQ